MRSFGALLWNNVLNVDRNPNVGDFILSRQQFWWATRGLGLTYGTEFSENVLLMCDTAYLYLSYAVIGLGCLFISDKCQHFLK